MLNSSVGWAFGAQKSSRTFARLKFEFIQIRFCCRNGTSHWSPLTHSADGTSTTASANHQRVRRLPTYFSRMWGDHIQPILRVGPLSPWANWKPRIIQRPSICRLLADGVTLSSVDRPVLRSDDDHVSRLSKHMGVAGVRDIDGPRFSTTCRYGSKIRT